MALVLAVGGCQCGDPGTGGARQGFRPQQDVLDFGRVLEGEPARREVSVLATGRASVTVTASTDAPFSVTAREVTVPGSGTATVEVVFTPGNGAAEGTLTLEGAGDTETVRLTGVGVRPKPCPAATCRQSRFDVESGECVETPLADGATCIPDSRCQENGRCQAGACVGSPRRCDDDNPCTTDACNPAVGCVTAAVACPRPSNPCKVGVCDREDGCGEANAANLTPCGPVDCVSANVCISGTCRAIPTPEGFVCAPETMCQGEGKCTSGTCVRPDAGELVPTFAQELGGEPVVEAGGPALLASGGALYTSVCSGDGGCRLVSFTNSGLLRYETPWPEDGGPRALLGASAGGVVVHESGALEAYASEGPGARLWRSPLEALAPEGTEGLTPTMGPGRTALTESGEVVALVSWGDVGGGGTGTLAVLGPEDGGVRVVSSTQLEGFGGEASLALNSLGVPFAYAAGGPLVRIDTGDGGTLQPTPLLERVEGGNAALAVGNGWVFAGTRAFVDTQGNDGGTVNWEAGTLPLTPLASPVLLSSGTGYVFAKVCPREDGVPCVADEERLLLRALDARVGSVRWESPVLAVDAPGSLHEAVLLQNGLVGAVTESRLPLGTRSYVQLYNERGRLSSCPLSGQPRVAGALFEGESVYMVLQRDGVWRLEAFGLGPGVSLNDSGWPQRHGDGSGSRRARP